mmetsp:Transcript_6351/g.11605  ORF Transcript_6351/g.11605 Transcript_6351/m.11605 type:complete len:215 (+) Transcript_6351:1891-2535(+)
MYKLALQTGKHPRRLPPLARQLLHHNRLLHLRRSAPRLQRPCLLLGTLRLLPPKHRGSPLARQPLLCHPRPRDRLRALLLGLRGRLRRLVRHGRVPIAGGAVFGALDGLLCDLDGARGLGTGGIEFRTELDDGLVELLDNFLVDAAGEGGDMGVVVAVSVVREVRVLARVNRGSVGVHARVQVIGQLVGVICPRAAPRHPVILRQGRDRARLRL